MPTKGATSTGEVLEQMILPALKHGGYHFKTKVDVGTKPGGLKQTASVLAGDETGRAVLISVMWQQVKGTAEQKVPFEVISLIQAVESGQGRYAKGYVVLGGKGWTLRDFYTSGGLSGFLKNSQAVEVISLEDFVAKANRKAL